MNFYRALEYSISWENVKVAKYGHRIDIYGSL